MAFGTDRIRCAVAAFCVVTAIITAPSSASAAFPTAYAWPVMGPVIRAFDPPSDPYGSGHRGIDIAATWGTDVHAAAGGQVAFAGKIGSGLYVSIDHPDGIRTTYSWLSSLAVRKGQLVVQGTVIGRTGFGHPGSQQPHLHLGARLSGEYIDPLSILGRPNLSGMIRLIPNGGRG